MFDYYTSPNVPTLVEFTPQKVNETLPQSMTDSEIVAELARINQKMDVLITIIERLASPDSFSKMQ